MEVEFDLVKNARNIALRGLPFDLVTHFDFDSALIRRDVRHDYDEVRFQAVGLIGNQLYFLVFTVRGRKVRVISLRLANRKEKAIYDKT